MVYADIFNTRVFLTEADHEVRAAVYRTSALLEDIVSAAIREDIGEELERESWSDAELKLAEVAAEAAATLLAIVGLPHPPRSVEFGIPRIRLAVGKFLIARKRLSPEAG
jgi:hypothetical protein